MASAGVARVPVYIAVGDPARTWDVGYLEISADGGWTAVMDAAQDFFHAVADELSSQLGESTATDAQVITGPDTPEGS